MANNFFTASGNPATGSQGSSATMRAEFEAIEDGFDKLPTMTGNGGKIVAVNSGGTALEPITTTGTGSAVRATSPTLVTPILGTPQSGTLTNCTGLPVSTGIAGLGSNVATALAVNVGTAGAFVANGGNLGTPSSGTLSNCTGLPVTTGISGLGSSVASFLATPSSSNLAAAVTDETGSGALVFADSPALTTPNIGAATASSINGTSIPSSSTLLVSGGALGTPSSGTLTNCSGLPISGISGLGTNVATALAVNVGSSGSFVTNGGALGTPSSGTVTNLTGTASININGTVGATTPNTGAFTTLSANNNVSFDGGTFVFNESGADKDLRIEGDSDANLIFSDASTDRVGFGTATPAQKVDIVGSLKFSGALYENVFTITDGGSVDINPANGTIQLWTLGASRTPTASNFAAGQSVTLMINDGTAYSITWSSIGVTWVNGSTPTLATSGYTVIELWKVASTVYGALVGSVA